MSDVKENKKAYQEAVKALKEDRINEIKVLVKEALEALQKAEKQRQESVEKIQFIKRDIDDLRNGRVDKIKERHEKIKKAETWSPITPQKIEKFIQPVYTITNTASDTERISWMTTYPSYTTVTGALGSFVSGTYVLDDGTIKHL